MTRPTYSVRRHGYPFGIRMPVWLARLAFLLLIPAVVPAHMLIAAWAALRSGDPAKEISLCWTAIVGRWE